MIFSATTLPGTGLAAVGAVAARRVAAWTAVWPVIAAFAAAAVRRGRRVVFFSEIICQKRSDTVGAELGIHTSSRDLSRAIADAIRMFFRVIQSSKIGTSEGGKKGSLWSAARWESPLSDVGVWLWQQENPEQGRKHFVNSTTIQENTHNLSEWRSVDPPHELPKLPKHAPPPTVQRSSTSKQHPHTLLQSNTHGAHRSTVPDMRTRLWQRRTRQSRLS